MRAAVACDAKGTELVCAARGAVLEGFHSSFMMLMSRPQHQ
jgi:hypothetical protein